MGAEADLWGDDAAAVAAGLEALDGHHPERTLSEREAAVAAVVRAARRAFGDEVRAVVDERDRYKAALERIARPVLSFTPSPATDVLADVARDALSQEGTGKDGG